MTKLKCHVQLIEKMNHKTLPGSESPNNLFSYKRDTKLQDKYKICLQASGSLTQIVSILL